MNSRQPVSFSAAGISDTVMEIWGLIYKTAEDSRQKRADGNILIYNTVRTHILL